MTGVETELKSHGSYGSPTLASAQVPPESLDLKTPHTFPGV